jgi:IrrE N-terminal-like domain
VSNLRRGFKTWCENAAHGYRRELGLKPFAPLDPRLLASKLDVRVWTPDDVPGVPTAALRQLTEVDPSSWSAVTLCVAGRHLIITNDRHSPERQNNSITHELSHLILEHKSAQVFVSSTGQMMLGHYDTVQEEEANCLSGALLVPREALLHVLSNGYDHARAAAYFVVARDLLRMRINLTGVQRQIAGRRRSA